MAITVKPSKHRSESLAIQFGRGIVRHVSRREALSLSIKLHDAALWLPKTRRRGRR